MRNYNFDLPRHVREDMCTRDKGYAVAYEKNKNFNLKVLLGVVVAVVVTTLLGI